MKKLLPLLLAGLLMMTSACSNTSNQAGTYTPGSYTGEGQGNNGPIKVEVIVKDGSITEINVLEQAETANIYAGAAEQFIPELIRTQNLDLDAVSGATNSSNGIREAVKDALGQ